MKINAFDIIIKYKLYYIIFFMNYFLRINSFNPFNYNYGSYENLRNCFGEIAQGISACASAMAQGCHSIAERIYNSSACEVAVETSQKLLLLPIKVFGIEKAYKTAKEYKETQELLTLLNFLFQTAKSSATLGFAVQFLLEEFTGIGSLNRGISVCLLLMSILDGSVEITSLIEASRFLREIKEKEGEELISLLTAKDPHYLERCYFSQELIEKILACSNSPANVELKEELEKLVRLQVRMIQQRIGVLGVCFSALLVASTPAAKYGAAGVSFLHKLGIHKYLRGLLSSKHSSNVKNQIQPVQIIEGYPSLIEAVRSSPTTSPTTLSSQQGQQILENGEEEPLTLQRISSNSSNLSDSGSHSSSPLLGSNSRSSPNSSFLFFQQRDMNNTKDSRFLNMRVIGGTEPSFKDLSYIRKICEGTGVNFETDEKYLDDKEVDEKHHPEEGKRQGTLPVGFLQVALQTDLSESTF